MLVPLAWLKDYVEIKMPLSRLVERLTEIGLAVEGTNKQGKEMILDLEVTPNRPDWLSLLGIAREIAAISQVKVKLPPIKELTPPKKSLTIKQIITYPQDTPRYSAVIIDQVKIKPSPLWMQARLKMIGLRPINNLVDITNYVMFELGNPLHAFDYDTLQPKRIKITRAKGGEAFTSVDGLDYKLPKGAIIIKDDPNRVIDLCGIKGGENTGITSKTKTVYLHSPVHPGIPIRLAGQALSLQSDASYIYERGVNPGGTVEAIKRAANLILKYGEGKIASKLFDLKKEEFEPWPLKISISRTNKVLGESIPEKEIMAILENLNLSPEKINQDLIKTTVPTYRSDLQIEEDLIEEIARIYGYNRFKLTTPRGSVPTKEVAYSRDYQLEKRVKNLLKGAGFTEVNTYSLLSLEELKKIEADTQEAIKLANPVSLEYEYLRPTLLVGILKAINLNQPHFEEIKIFELARVYLGQIPKTEEPLNLSSALTGNKFYQAKGVVETILESVGINAYQFEPYQLQKTFYGKVFHPSRTAEIMVKGSSLGAIGEINPHILTRFGIKKKVVVFDLDFEELVKHASKTKKYVSLSKYPDIVEDLAFIVPSRTLVGEIIDSIKKTSQLIIKVELLDTYKKIRTFRITYQSSQKTLTDKEVGKIRKKIIQKVSQKFKGKLKAHQ